MCVYTGYINCMKWRKRLYTRIRRTQIQGENFLMVQWLRLHASTAGGMGLIPDQGTKMPHVRDLDWGGEKKPACQVHGCAMNYSY